jgi:hypothetical protein
MKFTRKIRLDRIGSATLPARLGNIVEVSPECAAEEGAIVCVRALTDKQVYGEIELPNGRMAKIVRGNLIAGVLGARQALLGFMGHVPETLAPGDTLAVLNIGGVIGTADSTSKDLGAPIAVEVLGQVVRDGKPLNIADFAIPPAETLAADGPPIVLILGTCMNAGKTYAAAEIVRVLSAAGARIACGKVSGVAAQRDLLKMADNGAVATAGFLDCGLPSTVLRKELGPVARAVVQQLERSNPDMVLLELGDGIIGGYNTGSILADEHIRARTGARVLCANDLVGAWGGIQYLDGLGHRPDVYSGPVTDNGVGTSYITRELRVPAWNARTTPVELAREVARACKLAIEVGE